MNAAQSTESGPQKYARRSVIETEGWIATGIVGVAAIVGILLGGAPWLVLVMVAATVYFAHVTGQAKGIRYALAARENESLDEVGGLLDG